MMWRPCAGPLVCAAVGTAIAIALADSAWAQLPAAGAVPTESAPLQCWWRSDAGAIRLGEIVEVTLTCAVLDRDDLRAVPDESRLTVAAIQMAPFEIVGGSHPPDLRTAGHRLVEYRYQLRIIDADVIGRDVKLPPLAIPYRVESRVGAGTTLTGRDLVHLMPQLVFRVVSQVPADATDIRDAGDASLARVEALRFRASAFAVAAWLLAALAALVGVSVAVPLWRRARGVRMRHDALVSDRAVLQAAAARLGAVLDASPAADFDADAIAGAHHAMRLVAAIAGGFGVRQSAIPGTTAVPDGRLVATGWLGRTRAAVTAHITPATLTQRLDAQPPRTARDRMRLEGLRDGLALVTKAQYAAADRPDGPALAAALRAARELAADLARERRWQWRRSTPAADPARARTA
jgi:hypothetical protein